MSENFQNKEIGAVKMKTYYFRESQNIESYREWVKKGNLKP